MPGSAGYFSLWLYKIIAPNLNKASTHTSIFFFGHGVICLLILRFIVWLTVGLFVVFCVCNALRSYPHREMYFINPIVNYYIFHMLLLPQKNQTTLVQNHNDINRDDLR